MLTKLLPDANVHYTAIQQPVEVQQPAKPQGYFTARQPRHSAIEMNSPRELKHATAGIPLSSSQIVETGRSMLHLSSFLQMAGT